LMWDERAKAAIDRSRNGSTGSAIMAQLLAAANNVIYEWFGGTESRRSIERSIGWHANVEGIRQWVERLQAEEDGTWGSEGTPGRYPYKQVLAITQRTLPERQERQARHVKDCPARSSEDKYEDASGRHYEEARPRSHTPTHAAMVSVPCSASLWFIRNERTFSK